MNTESTVKVYWPGPPFDIVHHAHKVVVANGDNELPRSLATKLKQRFSHNGMTGLPEATTDEKGNVVEPSADLVAAVKAAADLRTGDAHRLGGQSPLKFDDKGKAAGPSAALVRDRAGSKLDLPQTVAAQPDEDKPKKGSKKKDAE